MKAKVQARVFSAKKTTLQDVVPLETPYSAHIDISSVCNFKCSFCFQSDQVKVKEKGIKLGFMDIELFKKIVDDLAEFKDKFKKIKIGNHGEPTLHPKLPEMISYVNSKNVTEIIELFTHGAILTPKLNLELVEAGLSRVNISVEGLTAKAYKKVADVDIDMDEFVKNIKTILRNLSTFQLHH